MGKWVYVVLEVLERSRRETAREYVMRVLQHNIVNLNLKPGQAISENEIAELLGVSRTPVREALIELSRASIVEIYPQKGTYISLIDMEMVEESRFMRCVLEKAIVELACDMLSENDFVALEENLSLQDSCVNRRDYKRLLNLDNKFHELLFKACNKERTYNLIASMMTHFNRVRILNLAEMDMQRTVNDHKEILQAIKDKDKQKAVASMERHLTRVIFDQSYLAEKHPEYFKQA
ncbi:MAG: GntR family transcriptional regulator, rspAB operon transcriptional repressor [Thermoanaerobacteraceae bacterium]|nr:GntR family transcriptional regulator, rspAB operon transcriptional repressor [Thermoanaerobacteraceae bacterium]